MQDKSETITVCGVHGDTVKLLDEIRTELARNTLEVAKVSNSLGWIKWVVTGAVGTAVTLLLTVIPFIVNMHTRITVLEKQERVLYETSERGHTTSFRFPTK
jgi:Fe2+ transport system protein B